MGDACRGAIKDLGLDGGRIAFDDLGFGRRLDLASTELADGYDRLPAPRASRSVQPPTMRSLRMG